MVKHSGRDVAALLAVVMLGSGVANAQARITNASASANAGQVDFSDGPTFNFTGAAATVGAMLAPPHVNAEARASFARSTNGAQSSEQFSVSGALLWWRPSSRLGLSAGRSVTDRAGPNVDVTHLHTYFVWFPSEQVTLSGKVGGFSGSAAGEYAGAAVNWYLTPDLAAFGAVDLTSFDAGFSEGDYTASVQWLPAQNLPVAFAIGVTRTRTSGRFDTEATASFVSMRVFYNRSGETSLRGRERTGPTGWPSAFGPQGVAY